MNAARMADPFVGKAKAAARDGQERERHKEDIIRNLDRLPTEKLKTIAGQVLRDSGATRDQK